MSFVCIHLQIFLQKRTKRRSWHSQSLCHFFFVLKSVSSIHYLTVLTTSICFVFFCMFVCSTHWVGYVHNIFKLYTAPYKEKKIKNRKKKTDNWKSTILSEAQQRWERGARPNAPWSRQESSCQRHRALGQALSSARGFLSAQTWTWGTLVAYKLLTCKPPQNYS